jgi:hypothetical protein
VEANGQWSPGVEADVQALGRTWRLSRATRAVWRGFADWAREVLPDPLASVAAVIETVAAADAAVMRGLMEQDVAGLTRARENGTPAVTVADKYAQMAEVLTQRALDRAGARFNWGCPEMMALLTRPDASARMVWLLLKKHQPDVTEDEADDVANELGPARFAELFVRASGRIPPEKKSPPSASFTDLAGSGPRTGGLSTGTLSEPTPSSPTSSNC